MMNGKNAHCASSIPHSAFRILFLPGMWGGDSGGGRAAAR